MTNDALTREIYISDDCINYICKS